jgi:hypothetical protein
VIGESGTTEVFAVSTTGVGEKDWRTTEAGLIAGLLAE